MAIKFNRSQTFATNGNVTAASLHNLIDGTDIYPALITDQSNLDTVSTADKLLIADTDDSVNAKSTTVFNLFDDALSGGTYSNAHVSGQVSYGTATGNRTVSTNASITTGTINNATLGTTTGTAATFTNGTLTIGVIPTGTFGTTTSTAATITNGTVATLNSTTGIITNLSTTLAGDFTISGGTGTLGTTGVTAGTYGTNTSAVTLTLDAKGRVTTISTSAIDTTPADGSITPAKLSQPLTLGSSVASTSGTAIDFTGIPSWAKRITVMFNGVSTNGTSEMILQIGDSGGIETSGYTGAVAQIANASTPVAYDFSTSIRTDGATNAAAVRHGAIVISLINQSSNLWSFNGCVGRSDSPHCSCLGGNKSLSDTLTQVRITTAGGTNTFDAGNINIMYEG